MRQQCRKRRLRKRSATTIRQLTKRRKKRQEFNEIKRWGRNRATA